MKAVLKQLLPPILVKGLKRSIMRRPAYDTYEEALSHCPEEAYEDTDIVRVVIEKNIAFRNQLAKLRQLDAGTLRTLIGIALAASDSKGTLNVIDFGGGGGYHYTIARTALGSDINLRWHVVETPAMVKEAKRICNDELLFFDSIEEAHRNLGNVDFVFTSGTLHCCPDPLYLLNELLRLRAKHLFVTRTSFLEAAGQIASVQKSFLSTNGPGPLPAGFVDKAVYYPNVFVSRERVEQALSQDYAIRFRLLEDKGVYQIGGHSIDMYGYFCERKN